MHHASRSGSRPWARGGLQRAGADLGRRASERVRASVSYRALLDAACSQALHARCTTRLRLPLVTANDHDWYCTQCGSVNPAGRSFCSQCGTKRAAKPMPTGDPPAVAARDDAERMSYAFVAGGMLHDPRRRRLFAAAAGAVVVAVAIGAGLLLLGDEDGTRSAQEKPASPTPSDSPEPAPGETPTSTKATPATVLATVARTRGVDGNDDGFVSVRRRADPDSSEVEKVYEGSTIRLKCQLRGPKVKASIMGRFTTVWARTTDGDYVTNAYLEAPGLKYGQITLPRC